MDKVITESIVGIAYVATMMAVLGAIALVLASVGVFGVMSYSVSERTHEIGIRMSMGAQTGNVLALVLRSGMLLTVLGLTIGLPVAFLLARALSSLLFGVQAADPASFIGLHSEKERSEEHTSELQSPDHLVCRLLLEKKKKPHTVTCKNIKDERELLVAPGAHCAQPN